MATMEKLMRAFESLKSFQQQQLGPTVPEELLPRAKKDPSTNKKDRVNHCLTICENIVAQSLRNSPEFQKLLGIAMELFLLCSDDSESDVRMVADECLNKVVKALMDSNLPRLQLELYKEIKKNGAPRSLRAALWRFAELAHLVRPQKCRPYLVNLLPCLTKICKRQEESVQETLAAAIPKIMSAFGNFANDHEIKVLLKAFVANLKSSSPAIRRTAAGSAVQICQHSRRTQYFYTWLLNVLLGLLIPIEDEQPTLLILGVLLTLRYLIPLLQQQVKDTSLKGSFGVTRKEAEISPSQEQLTQVYELTLHFTQHRDHNVVTGALELLQQIFRTPPIELLHVLTSSGAIQHISICRDESQRRSRSGSIVELIAGGSSTCSPALSRKHKGKLHLGEEEGLEDESEGKSDVATAPFTAGSKKEGSSDATTSSGVPTPASATSLDASTHDIITEQPRSQHTLQSDSVDLSSSDVPSTVTEGDEEDILSRSSSQISTVQSDTNMDMNEGTTQASSPVSDSSQTTTEGPDSAVTPSDSSEIVIDGAENLYSGMQIGQLQDEEDEGAIIHQEELADRFGNTALEDGDAVSSSYESYDEEENLKKSLAHQHQWPSTEASIELMKDALICAFLWRKKWLGQWAKQLCVIKDNRLLCYKSSKEHSPLLDVCLIGCTVTHKEKQVRKKEHKLKITPTNTDVIVLGMQSKDQAIQWLKVIQDIGGLQTDATSEISLSTPDTLRNSQTKGEITDRYSAASESGSSTDGHPETADVKEVKKKGTSGLKLSNLMNLGRKKSSSMESPEKSLETSNYLNVLINSHWKSRYCCIKEGQLHIFQERNKSKAALQPVSLLGCDIIPQPTPDHLYSFRILHNGEELAMLEAKSSEDMGHWLGLLLSESGSKTDPEEFDYDYVDAERVSCIVSAAKNSYFLMQRKYSEPNTYIDNPRGGRSQQDDLYDDVDVSDAVEEEPKTEAPKELEDHTYLDLLPGKSFLHSGGMKGHDRSLASSPGPEIAKAKDVEPESALCSDPEPPCPVQEETEPGAEEMSPGLQVREDTAVTASPLLGKNKADKGRPTNAVAIENKLGKNRTEAEARRFTEVKEKLEKEREDIREQLAHLRKEKRELKENIATCSDKSILPCLEEKLKSKEEECKQRENQRVDLELQIVEVKENLRKAELGPVTLGTAVDPAHLDSSQSVKTNSPSHIPDSSPVNCAMALKARPLSIMTTGKGTVLQKAKEWEKKGAS